MTSDCTHLLANVQVLGAGGARGEGDRRHEERQREDTHSARNRVQGRALRHLRHNNVGWLRRDGHSRGADGERWARDGGTRRRERHRGVEGRAEREQRDSEHSAHGLGVIETRGKLMQRM